MSANIDYPESRHFLTAYHHPRPRAIICFWIIALSFSCPCSYSLLSIRSQSGPIKHMAGQVTSLLKTFWRALISPRVRAVVTVVHTICDLAPSSLWLPLISPPPQPCSLTLAMSAFLLILYICLFAPDSHMICFLISFKSFLKFPLLSGSFSVTILLKLYLIHFQSQHFLSSI